MSDKDIWSPASIVDAGLSKCVFIEGGRAPIVEIPSIGDVIVEPPLLYFNSLFKRS